MRVGAYVTKYFKNKSVIVKDMCFLHTVINYKI